MTRLAAVSRVSVPGRVDLAPRALAPLLNRYAPFAIIAGILLLAVAIIIGEWRSGTLGVAKPIDVRSVVFAPTHDGMLDVHLVDGAGRARVVTLPSASEGFVATLAKSLARDRRRFDVAPSLPYRLTRFANGALLLKDPVIGTDVRLEAFGLTNAKAFAALLDATKYEEAKTP